MNGFMEVTANYQGQEYTVYLSPDHIISVADVSSIGEFNGWKIRMSNGWYCFVDHLQWEFAKKRYHEVFNSEEPDTNR